MASKPTLHYFDVNGRGEVSKMVAAVGGLDIDIVEYPDSGKVAAAHWSHPEAERPEFVLRTYAGASVDYWEGED